MAATSFGGIFIAILLGGGFFGLPLGIPPLPEEPLLAKVAPAECLWYWSSAGMAAPDPASGNHTEQLLAEEQVQRLIKTLEKEVLAAIARNPSPREEQRVAATEVPKLLRAFLTRPWAFFVSKVAITPEGPSVEAGLVVHLGDAPDETLKSLTALEQLALEGAEPEVVEEAGVTWHKLPLPPGAPPALWGAKGKYLIVAIGEGSGAAILERARMAPPKWLTDLRGSKKLKRISMVSYTNVQGMLAAAAPLLGNPRFQAPLEFSGLKSIGTITNVSGMDETGCVSHTHLTLAGEAKGLLFLADGKPLTAADLAAIPADATLAGAVRADAGRFFGTILDLVKTAEPRERERMDRDMDRFAEETGVHPRKDLLDSLGDVWTLYASPSDGGFPWPGVVATVTVNDAKKLKGAHDKLVALFRQMNPDPPPMGRRRTVTLRETTAGDQTIYYVNAIGEEMPVAPAWCLTEKSLVIGLYPQAVASHLARSEQSAGEGKKLTDVPEVAAALKSGTALGVTYSDTRALFRLLYPWVQIGFQFGSTQWQREGINLDISHLPAANTIEKHLFPSVSTVVRTKTGVEWTQHRTAPVGSITSSAPILTALMLPAVSSAREAAMRNSDINNLKQMALALLNHHDVRKRMPAPNGGKGENRGLSWRVAILPFLEEQALYEAFHHDEPWDSEHNLKLIERMPAIYRGASPDVPAKVAAVAPGGKVDANEAKYAAYKTRFVTFRHEKSAFPESANGQGLPLKAFTDGTSRTVTIIQAAPESAVIWTKPDDLNFDPEKPRQGIFGSRGFALAVFADGHVQALSAGLSDEILRAIVTRNGGEAIRMEELEAPPRKPGFASSTATIEAKPRPKPPETKSVPKPAPPKEEDKE